MKILKNSDHLALYVHPGYESLIFVAYALGAAGFKTITATYDSNILEGISDFSNLDVIVFDQMREMEYLNYCSKLKNNERTKNIPIIVIVDNEDITQDQVISSGADKYLKTPLDIIAFRENITAYLRRQSY